MSNEIAAFLAALVVGSPAASAQWDWSEFAFQFVVETGSPFVDFTSNAVALDLIP